jgi:hypothetical protein
MLSGTDAEASMRSSKGALMATAGSQRAALALMASRYRTFNAQRGGPDGGPPSVAVLIAEFCRRYDNEKTRHQYVAELTDLVRRDPPAPPLGAD